MLHRLLFVVAPLIIATEIVVAIKGVSKKISKTTVRVRMNTQEKSKELFPIIKQRNNLQIAICRDNWIASFSCIFGESTSFSPVKR